MPIDAVNLNKSGPIGANTNRNRTGNTQSKKNY